LIDGIYYNPTMFYFGKNMEAKVGEAIPKYSRKLLLHYGNASFKKYGLYDKVITLIKNAGVSYIELGGVKSNPRSHLVYEGIELCRTEGVDFILAVGGGSVIDSAKAISIGVPYQGDFFDFFIGRQIPQDALKIGTILTVPGAGSESNPGAVITDEKREMKIVYSNSIMFPVFAILNPELTVTVNKYNTACGIVDAISHLFERYFTNTSYVDCSDRICEGLIKTLMKYAISVRDEPYNYDVRAEIMWACKLAHDNTAGFGRKQDWATHAISHELGARYDVPHGAALSVIFPAWMKYVYSTNLNRFTQFANRVFDIDISLMDGEQAILSAINNFMNFLKSIGMPLTLREIGINNNKHFDKIAQKCVAYMPSGTVGNFARLSPLDITHILETAY